VAPPVGEEAGNEDDRVKFRGFLYAPLAGLVASAAASIERVPEWHPGSSSPLDYGILPHNVRVLYCETPQATLAYLPLSRIE